MPKRKQGLSSGGAGMKRIRNTHNLSSHNTALGDRFVQLLIDEKQQMDSTTWNLGNYIQRMPVRGFLWTGKEKLFHFKAIREQILYTASS